MGEGRVLYVFCWGRIVLLNDHKEKLLLIDSNIRKSKTAKAACGRKEGEGGGKTPSICIDERLWQLQ